MQLELIDQARRALTRCGARPLLSGPLAVPLFKAFAQPLQNSLTNRWTLFQTEVTGDAPWELRSSARARRLGVAPANCLVFEDSHAGVTAAKAAGMWCIALDRDSSHPQDLSAADWVLPDLAAFSVEAFRRRVTSF